MDNLKDIQKACADLTKADQKFKEATKGLKALIENSYISQSKTAQKIGLTPQSFCRKLTANDWTVKQIIDILAVIKKFKADPFE